MSQTSSSHLHRANRTARTKAKEETRPTRVCCDDSNEEQPTTQKHTNAQEQQQNLTEVDKHHPHPVHRCSSSSSLLILHCPSRATIIASILTSPFHITETVIQSLTSVSAGPTKTSPSTLQPNTTETRSQPAPTAQYRSDLLRIPRRYKHCDKHSTVRYGYNRRVNTSGGCLETDYQGWQRKRRQIHEKVSD